MMEEYLVRHLVIVSIEILTVSLSKPNSRLFATPHIQMRLLSFQQQRAALGKASATMIIGFCGFVLQICKSAYQSAGTEAIAKAKRSLPLHFHLAVKHPSVPKQSETIVTAGYDVWDGNTLA